MIFLTLLIIAAATTGLVLAAYIQWKKATRGNLVCPLRSNCTAVIESEYSKFLGIPVELLGIVYYALIAASYALFLLFPPLAVPSVVFVVLVLSTAAVLFSVYLTFIQAAVLKQWCVWCLCSAGLCVVIFSFAILRSDLGFVPLLALHRTSVLIAHLFGVTLGLGGATISDIFFFKFLKDFQISEKEAEVLHTLSQIIWVALIILILSGVALYLPASERLNESSKFLLKMVVVLVLSVNGLFLNLLIGPRLVRLSFRGPGEDPQGNVRRLRRFAFALGAVSMTSWYTAFILGALRAVPLSFPVLLLGYLLLVGLAVSMSQVVERSFERRATSLLTGGRS